MIKKRYLQPEWHFLNLYCRLSLLEISVKDGAVNSITVGDSDYNEENGEIY